jgi:hypothetical protein
VKPRDSEDVELFAETVAKFRSLMSPFQSLAVSDDDILTIWMAHSDRHAAQWMVSDDIPAEYIRGLLDGYYAGLWEYGP